LTPARLISTQSEPRAALALQNRTHGTLLNHRALYLTVELKSFLFCTAPSVALLTQFHSLNEFNKDEI
jgi:hypothetical protein